MKQLKKLKEEQAYNQFTGLCDNLVSAYASLNSSVEVKKTNPHYPPPPGIMSRYTMKESFPRIKIKRFSLMSNKDFFFREIK